MPQPLYTVPFALEDRQLFVDFFGQISEGQVESGRRDQVLFAELRRQSVPPAQFQEGSNHMATGDLRR